jgi:hypothetical protein
VQLGKANYEKFYQLFCTCKILQMKGKNKVSKRIRSNSELEGGISKKTKPKSAKRFQANCNESPKITFLDLDL